jgi:RNA polymerase sigma-70 factor (ECF subfamily)
MQDPPAQSAEALVEDLFRRESARLVSALARALGPSNLPLAEDAVHDALLSAMQAWRFGPPRDPKAWLLRAAKNRAIDLLRRGRRFTVLPPELDSEQTLVSTVDDALSPREDCENQLSMMFSICDGRLSAETQITLILRILCGLSGKEIARAFVLDTQTIERRLHRGRARLQELGRLHDVSDAVEVAAREPSVLHALYLLFNEGYHGSDPEDPLQPALCADALRLSEMLLSLPLTSRVEAHALSALFCFNAARLATRMDADGVFLPLSEQDRSLWDAGLLARGVAHFSETATGTRLTRWHLEAGIACEHSLAASVEDTNWSRVVVLYDALFALSPSPVVALNRALAIAELRGLTAGREALLAVACDPRLAAYPFFWLARADIERRAGRTSDARPLYAKAIALSRSRAERVAFERKLALLQD